MRAKYLWPCLIVCAVATSHRAAAQSGIRWQSNLETAKRIAAQTNRLVLLHFWTESCGPCMQMERNVFPRPDVAAALEANFVPVRTNAPQLARQFGVEHVPTDIILTPQGEIVERREGGLDAAQYVAAMSQIAARARGMSSKQVRNQAAAPPRYGSAATAEQPAGTTGPNRPWPPSGSSSENANTQQPPYTGRSAMSGVQSPPMDKSRRAYPPQQDGLPLTQQRNPSPEAAYQPGPPPGSSANPSLPPSVGQTTPPPSRAWQGEAGQWNSGNPANPSFSAASAAAPPAREEVVGALPGAGSRAPQATDLKPANPPPLCLDGYCSVTLSEQERWAKGDPRFGVIHRGRTYLFAGPDEAKRFLADPDRYAPVLSGIDLVVAVEENRHVPGKREYGASYDGRVYLFSCEASFRKFHEDPDRYVEAAARVAAGSARRPARRSEPAPFDRYSEPSPYGPPARY